MNHDPIEAYLRELERGLHCSRQRKRHVVMEVRGHLREAEDALVQEGFKPGDAKALAVARFGSAGSLADGLSGRGMAGWLTLEWYTRFAMVMGLGTALLGLSLLLAPFVSKASGGTLEANWGRESLRQEIQSHPCLLSARCLTGTAPRSADEFVLAAAIVALGGIVAGGHRLVQRELLGQPEAGIAVIAIAGLMLVALLASAWGSAGLAFRGSQEATAHWATVTLVFGLAALAAVRLHIRKPLAT